ncbi:MAG TPA: hypothetical protein V6D11_14900 [Waterburya sp.]|jgi:hypothetical protein
MDGLELQRMRVERLQGSWKESVQVINQLVEELKEVKDRLIEAMSQEKSIRDDYNQALAEYQLLLRNQK